MKISLFALGVVVTVFLVFGMTHLDGLRWDYDESVHAMEAVLFLDGLPLYHEVYSSDMPLFIGSLDCAFALLRSSIQVVCLVALIYAALELPVVADRHGGGYVVLDPNQLDSLGAVYEGRITQRLSPGAVFG